MPDARTASPILQAKTAAQVNVPMNLSEMSDAITEADAQRLSAVLRGSPLLDDPELMRRIRGIRRDYPDDHWWWYPERL